ncbi:uncharacterized protein LOC118589669 [Onychomys torridus]|uniref:uncharacterized protein LOC118589669 n=1 Tax=Onychomys torridus TaxID=38674 RepID=UPI00167F2755|nr:uncharacterized protein LOC118589669 [Onychomys torridus]
MKARLADEASNTVLLNQEQVLQQVTSSCPACAQVKPGKTHLNRRSCLRGHRPRVHWELDFTEVKPGLYGYRYLLVFVDTFSGWTEKETATMVTQKLLDDIFPSPTLEAHLQALQLVQKTVWKPLADAYWEQLNRPVMSHPFKIENSVWVHVSYMKAVKEPDKAENLWVPLIPLTALLTLGGASSSCSFYYLGHVSSIDWYNLLRIGFLLSRLWS